MTKPVTGQYEYLHRSGVGLDYFTSRIDRLVLQPNGRFILTIQDSSRIANAAKSLVSGQQPTAAAPETRREGSYIYPDAPQGNRITLNFDDGGLDYAQPSWNGDGLQIGPYFFNKVSDSTFLPPPQRLKKDMDDIAKGLKIASTLGGMAVKAAKTIQETIHAVQGPEQGQQPPAQGNMPPVAQPAPPPPGQPAQPVPPVTPSVSSAPAVQPPPPREAVPPAVSPRYTETIFCDQCGARCRPGKRFCNNCGARLP